MLAEPYFPAASPDLLPAVHVLMEACHREADALEPYRSPHDTAAFLLHPPADQTRTHWTVTEDRELLGFAVLRHLRGAATAYLELCVRLDARRRGVGTTLLAAARARAAADGIRSILGEHATDPGAAFSAAVGAHEGQRDLRQVRRLDEPLPEPLPVAGYRLSCWTGACPEPALASYALARAAINDAPHADTEAEPWTPERIRDLEATAARRGRTVLVTAALDAAGRVVAFTEMRLSDTPAACIEDTAVVAEHRGRGLASWIKTVALHRLRTDYPHIALAATTNAGGNASILAVNTRLGFVRAVEWTTAVLAIDS
jgi:GNAT superfamily N-acetyltransferase